MSIAWTQQCEAAGVSFLCQPPRRHEGDDRQGGGTVRGDASSALARWNSTAVTCLTIMVR